jgi:hypothetical protein
MGVYYEKLGFQQEKLGFNMNLSKNTWAFTKKLLGLIKNCWDFASKMLETKNNRFQQKGAP